MEKQRPLLLITFAVGLAALLMVSKRPSSGLNIVNVSSKTNISSSLPSAMLLPSTEAATKQAIDFFTARVNRDPEDCRSQNSLAAYYLQRLRETGNEDFVPLALKAARASLSAVAAEANTGGLAALARAEFANHDFESALDHAIRLTELEAGKSEPHALVGDALLELGVYEQAAEAFQRMQRLGEDNAGTQTRLARLAFLQGRTEQAREHFLAALRLLLASTSPPREAVAWCRWQLGETAFSTGDYATAERCYRDALITSPGYFKALASMGRVQAARGDLPEAILRYEEAVAVVPAPEFLAALGDLYKLSGQEKEAGLRHESVERLADHSRTVHGQPHNRQLALFYADHDIKAETAYALAKGEYAVRRDIYGADALAWTALKSGRLTEAQAAIKEALRLGTRDAKLLYHAGMIARAASDQRGAVDYLSRALALNPKFDPLQSATAHKAINEGRKLAFNQR